MIARTRRLAAAAGAVLLAASLAACAQLPESAAAGAGCVPAAGAGDAAAAVATPGAFGVSADPSFPTPLRADAIEVRRTGDGAGDPVTEHGVLAGNLQVLDAATGTELVAYQPLRAGVDGAAGPITAQSLRSRLPGLADAVQCARAGERVTAVMPSSSLFGAALAARMGDVSGSAVVVVDVTRVYPSSAAGVVLPPSEGMPAVVAAPSGQPGVTMPQQEPPTTPRSAVRVQGHGPAVADGELVTLHASVFSWESGAELGSTWDASNSVLQLAARAGDTDDGLYGATAPLVGQAVGSQLIVVLPPESTAGRRGPLDPSTTHNVTLVLVIDVLAADPAKGA